MGLVLAGTAVGSAALTIGAVRSPVWLEQRLDITVPVQLDPGAAPDALCTQAEVLFGDNTLSPSQVQVAVENAAAADSVKLRITTSTPVNEPIVTLVLQLGCTQKVSRQFLLLPDMPVLGDSAPRRDPALADPAPVPLVSVASTATPAATGAVSTETASATSTATTGSPQKEKAQAVSGPVAAPVAPAVVARPKPKPRLRLELQAPVPRRTPPPTAAATGPHLALEPLQALGEQVRKLEETAPLPQEATSAASAPEVDRMQQLQSDIQLLLKQAADNDAKLAALRERMEQAESDRATMASALGVGGILLLLAAAVALWMYRRQRAAQVDADEDWDPEAQNLIVDFNPVDADQWEPPAPAARAASKSPAP